jgi:hypothetical protein
MVHEKHRKTHWRQTPFLNKFSKSADIPHYLTMALSKNIPTISFNIVIEEFENKTPTIVAKSRLFPTNALKSRLGEPRKLFSAIDKFYDTKDFQNLLGQPYMEFRKERFNEERKDGEAVWQISQDYDASTSTHVVKVKKVNNKSILEGLDNFLTIHFTRYVFEDFADVYLDVVHSPIPYEVVSISYKVDCNDEHSIPSDVEENLQVAICRVCQTEIKDFPTYSKFFYALKTSPYSHLFKQFIVPVEYTITKVIADLLSEDKASSSCDESTRTYLLSVKIVPGWVELAMASIGDVSKVHDKNRFQKVLTQFYQDISDQYKETLNNDWMYNQMITDDDDY